MARASYGPEAKKRSRRLLETLLAFANDEINCQDEAALDLLRPQIQTRWQSENQLIVRTKVRFLQSLTGLTSLENQLNAEQIKEALKRFADFLEILEDNRPTRGGSETWHFTLKLWHKRQDTEANLQAFDCEWERRRPEKSKQVTEAGEAVLRLRSVTRNRGAGEEITSSSPQVGERSRTTSPQVGERSRTTSPQVGERSRTTSPDWQQLCRTNLEAQNHGRLTTNPLTSADGVTFELDQVYVPLRLVEQKQRLRHRDDVIPQEGSRLYEPEDAEITQTFDHNEFIQQVLRRKQKQRIAIIGEPGAGKTTLLQKIAGWVLENTEDLPIWISLADLQGKTLEQYLIQDWLPSATRKLRVPPEIEEAFCQQFNQGRVWLLLDAVDEMAIESSHALAKIASCLTGWIADASVVLTCRVNVWDTGKNALESFDTYRNLNLTYGKEQLKFPPSDQVGQFIERWFQENPVLAESLRTELNQPERRRIKDVVKNPLRLALLCRTWGLWQGRFPNTKAMLYEQFVEAIYEWKQDRFPTTFVQRSQLNRALGELALLAMSNDKSLLFERLHQRAYAQEKTKFRLRHRFVCQVLGAPDDGLFQLALQLGWLNQVGISETPGEKVYAFYHPTFQEYFAAQAITDWRFFLNHTLEDGGNEGDVVRLRSPTWGNEGDVVRLRSPTWGNEGDVVRLRSPTWGNEGDISSLIPLASNYYIFEPQWREVILLWLGRDDIPQENKEEFIEALINFSDGCGGIYRYQAYFLAAQGIAEFVDCQKADEIVQQLIEWRFGYLHSKKQKWWRYPLPIVECARVALLKTDRPKAIAALEKFITSTTNEFESWNAAYTLGKVFDPGNQTAIAALEKLVKTVRHESIRWQAAYSLARVDAGNETAITALVEIIKSTKSESTCRKAAYSLAKIDFENAMPAAGAAIAVSTLEKIAASATDASQRRQAAANLETLRGITQLKEPSPPAPRSQSVAEVLPPSPTLTASLLQGIASGNDDTRRRRAYKLAKLDPGNKEAFITLLQLLKSTQSESVGKRIVGNLKEIIQHEQLPEVIASLKNCFSHQVSEDELEQFRECYKLLWYCAENINYLEFYRIWHNIIKH